MLQSIYLIKVVIGKLVDTAAGIGAAASTIPAMATSSQMGVPASISTGLFETLATSNSSCLATSVSKQFVVGSLGAATEVTTTLVVEQTKKVYENIN